MFLGRTQKLMSTFHISDNIITLIVIVLLFIIIIITIYKLNKAFKIKAQARVA